jgi:hypothetical protein
VRVSFALPTGEQAMLEIVDVAGRRAATREVGSLGAGRHTVDLGAERGLPAGVYFLRLTQGTHRATARVTVLN